MRPARGGSFAITLKEKETAAVGIGAAAEEIRGQGPAKALELVL